MIRAVATCMLLMWSPSLLAHQQEITDTQIDVGLSKLKVVYTFPDSRLEIATATREIPEKLEFTNNDKACSPIAVSAKSLESIESTQIAMILDCGAPIDVLTVHDHAFFDEDPSHVNHVRLSLAGRNQAFELTDKKRLSTLPVAKLLKLWGRGLSDDGFAPSPKMTPWRVSESLGFSSYFKAGVNHILSGFDHLLFLLALLLVPFRPKQLAGTITAFTLAHSITLAMSVFDVLTIPSHWVEAIIALSIGYVGIENLIAYARGTQNEQGRHRIVVAFCFGLLHGFGFSYFLKEMGLGGNAWGALAFFNLGVEAGQLLVVAVVAPLLYAAYRRWPRADFAKVLSALVTVIAVFWFIERLV